MKIKCPFCRNIYDPEACDNTCPMCSKKLMVAVFKKKPEGKPGAGPATTFKPMTVPPTPPPSAVPPPPPPPPHPAPAPLLPVAPPMTEFVAPKAPVIMPVIKAPPPTVIQTQRVMEQVAPPEPVPEPQVIKVVMPPPTMPVAPPPEPVPAPEPHAEKKPAHPGQAKSGLDLVISLQQGTGADWDAVIRVPVQVFKLANLIPARAREAIEAEGIAFEELRKAVEHTTEVGPLLDIQTQTQHVHIAIEAHG